MNKRAIEFVEAWIAKTIHARTSVQDGFNDGRSEELAELCLAEAEKEGISPVEIKKEYFNLADRMAHAITNVAKREADQLP